MIDPKTVLVGIPCHDGKNMTELTGMLVTCRDLYGGITMPTECSHPSLVRNIIADTFLRSPFQWLVGIDSDIVFQRSDFLMLLEETVGDTIYGETIPEHIKNNIPSNIPKGLEIPVPTRIEASCVDLVPTSRWYTIPVDALVCAEYAYKREPFEPVRFGGGFYRVHRHVFEVLQELKHADDGRVTVDRLLLDELLRSYEEHWPTQAGDPGHGTVTDSRLPADILKELRTSMTALAGTPRLWQAHYQGRTFYDYYPSGPLISQQVPTGEWKGEDHGFWTLCHLAGLIPRIERRTRVIHIGRKGYAYEPEQEIAQ